jgi:23S rRNA pseudouridine1911/1915/1917 synthase
MQKIFSALIQESMVEPEPSTGLSRHLVTIEAGSTGQRLDTCLAAALPQLSRARLQQLMRQGHVRDAAGPIAEPSRRVKPGEAIEVTIPPAAQASPEPQALALDILFEDEHLIVLVKPAGLVVHPAPGHDDGTLVNALLAHCGDSLSGIGGVRRPGIVHRIDREVSGVLVVAKHDRAHIGLAAQFSLHSVDRIYEAIVWGVPGRVSATVDRPLARHPTDRKRMAIVQGGKRAVTHWRLAEAAATTGARLEVELETGRTHQIRVHLSSLGHPILGDRVYGRRAPRGAELRRFLDGFARIALHARDLGFDHPITGQRQRFTAPTPPCFARLMELLRTD